MKLAEIPTRDEQGHVRVVVESPRGSRAKLKYEPSIEAFVLSRPLVLGLAYPFDWGFIPGTRGPDGDPLDAMVLIDLPTHPGVVIASHPLGVLEITQKSERGGREHNDRILMTPVNAPRFEGLRDARELPERARKELEAFFVAATTFEDKGLEIVSWTGPEAADELVRRGSKAA
ncbi:Inorganic pyrophosphatase [Minicystis rosea]|nr:Inorganic pyrophosphatase [Minicystis rosea]